LVLGTGAVARSPSPWFGAWVEMHEQRIAVTIPEDRVGFDRLVDGPSQLDEASDHLGKERWSADDTRLADALT